MKDEKENEFIYENYFDDTDDYDHLYPAFPKGYWKRVGTIAAVILLGLACYYLL